MPSTLPQKILQHLQRGRAADWRGARWTRLALDLARHQARRNPVFQKWVRAFVAPQGELPPFLPITAFAEARVACFPAGKTPLFFQSSGTTAGAKKRGRHEFRSLELYRASVIAGWRWFQDKMGNDGKDSVRPRFLALMPSSREAPHSSLSRMLDLLMHEFGDECGFWAMRDGRWDWRGFAIHLRQAAREKRPVVLFGTAFAWVHGLEWCQRHHLHLTLPRQSIALETGGTKGRSREIGREELHRSIRRTMGIPASRIFSEYSMCEISSQAWSRRVKGRDGRVRHLFQFPPWCRPRVVRPGGTARAPRGVPGVLEIADLANADSCAFLRTGDRAVDWGEGFELLGRIPRAGLKGCSLAFE